MNNDDVNHDCDLLKAVFADVTSHYTHRNPYSVDILHTKVHTENQMPKVNG